MLKAGQTILLPKPGQDTPHLWVVVLPSDESKHETVIVNLTSLREHSEKTVVLQAGEHPFITHPSVVHYVDSRIVDAHLIANALSAGTFRAHADCSVELLRRIQAGLLASAFVPQKVKAFAKKQLGVA